MKFLQSSRLVISAVLGLLLASSRVHAAPITFGDFSNFTNNHPFGQPAITSSAGGGMVELVHGAGAQFANILYDSPQNITQFNVSFIYQSTIISGAALGEFLLENTPAGSNYTGGIVSFSSTDPNTAAFEPPSNLAISPTANSGNFVSPTTVTTSGVVSVSDPVNVAISYNGSILQQTSTDTVTSGFITETYAVNLPAILGGSTAYVGFAASSGQNSTVAFSAFQFTSVPEPATFGLIAFGMATTMLRPNRRRSGPITKPICQQD